MPRAPVIALSHGGGPMPILGDPGHAGIVHSLRTRVPSILNLNTPDAPRAIVLVTAHWTTEHPTISNAAKHELYYDYYGFPKEAYGLKYDAPGSSGVAREVFDVLRGIGMSPVMDGERGWDHGVFIPMMLVAPEAKIPIIQLSVLESESPEDHFRMGTALQKLRDSNIAIVGSGFASIHNVRLMMSGQTRDPAFIERNKAWSEKLTAAVSQSDVEQRTSALKGWREFPGAYEMHPRGGAEHFLPLLVCAAAGGDGEVGVYADKTFGVDVYSYYWQ